MAPPLTSGAIARSGYDPMEIPGSAAIVVSDRDLVGVVEPNLLWARWRCKPSNLRPRLAIEDLALLSGPKRPEPWGVHSLVEQLPEWLRLNGYLAS